ncbi:amidohydrolase [Acidomonas methanolica]|uniref:Amidohydrolase/peptidase M20 n=1 Tax=Acidomonas methanolica NBRC 104435 TaxID=1231351 RepID=A0A023D1B3_ACIMT|nr:amidohydrolase [Acidomonas methanolica]MBU2654132.1 amidohydrolase [Acidomonas methanolica]TCS30640.1 hippurate hydrolase [Acidomonas methanolica]GAJ27596.1 amidohydrolase/peptidase M20 [Acidomonas methanolica NBRC 104435]GBQ52011.1 amidohydrolase [Acidomonas methanolica]GEK98800.1 hydrolase [Acidomonas methanolica NBRC 104435]
MRVTPVIDHLVALRRDLHAHPELRFEEVRTAGIVADQLAQWGYRPHRGLAKTGVVASLDTGRPGPSILLRADMDALPVTERAEHDHVSRHAGRMHACGHDGHTVMLLGAAAELAARPPARGRVHFVFQPAEEGGAGADVMIREGLFDLFPSQRCFGLHNWPGLAVGRFGVRAGPIMAGGWRFSATVSGRGAHAAQPHRAIDPVVAGAAFVQAAQHLVARRTDPLVPAVVSICMFHAGSTDNILPDRAEIAGTLRALAPGALEALKEGLREVAEGTERAFGVRIALLFHSPYPVTVNSPAETALAGAVMTGLDASTDEAPADLDLPPSLASEDFGFMLERRPGAYAMIGNGPSAPLHAPDYDFNDRIIPRGIAYWAALARHCLSEAQQKDTHE